MSITPVYRAAGSSVKFLDIALMVANAIEITNFDEVIDWDQWTGEDFFFVWPLTGHRLCTERAAKWLGASGIRSFRLSRGFEWATIRDEFGAGEGSTTSECSNSEIGSEEQD
jgi:hypothetical protein